MPFVSQQQRKYMYSQEPELAKKFEKDTPKGKKLPKKVKEGADVGQGFDNQVGDMYAVQRPYDGCASNKLVHKVDPLMGINGAGIDPTQVYGAYLDEKAAIVMAEKLYKEFTDAAIMLEKKKEMVVGRIKTAIDELEAKRSESVNIIKENPKESGAHKETIAQLATKIDDLMNKLEKIENSKKEIEKDEEKKDLKEGLTKQSKLSSAEYQKEKKKKDFKASDWKWNKEEDLYIKTPKK